MVCSRWRGALVVMLLSTGLAWSQSSPYSSGVAPAARVSETRASANVGDNTSRQFLFVANETGVVEKCRCLGHWRISDNKIGCLVKSLTNGQLIVVTGSNPFDDTLDRQTYHWGTSTTCPPGWPAPPASIYSGGANASNPAIQEVYQEAPLTGRMARINNHTNNPSRTARVVPDQGTESIPVRDIDNPANQSRPTQAANQLQMRTETLALTAKIKGGPEGTIPVGKGRGTKSEVKMIAQARGVTEADLAKQESVGKLQVLSQSREVISSKAACATLPLSSPEVETQANAKVHQLPKAPTETAMTPQTNPAPRTLAAIRKKEWRPADEEKTTLVPISGEKTDSPNEKDKKEKWTSIPLDPVPTATVMAQEQKAGKEPQPQPEEESPRIVPQPVNQSPYAPSGPLTSEVVSNGHLGQNACGCVPGDCTCHLPECTECQDCCEIPSTRRWARILPFPRFRSAPTEHIHVHENQPYQAVSSGGHYQRIKPRQGKRFLPSLFAKRKPKPTHEHLVLPDQNDRHNPPLAQIVTEQPPKGQFPPKTKESPKFGERVTQGFRSIFGMKSKTEVSKTTKLPKRTRKPLSTARPKKACVDPLEDPVDSLSSNVKRKFTCLPKKCDEAVPPPGCEEPPQHVRQVSQNSRSAREPYIPLGSRSVIEASNGFPTQYIPYPVITTPKPNHPPMPPPPAIPQAPNPTAHLNAFAPRNWAQQMANAPQAVMAHRRMPPPTPMMAGRHQMPPHHPMMAGRYQMPPQAPHFRRPGMPPPNYSGFPTAAARQYPGPMPPNPMMARPGVAQVGYPHPYPYPYQRPPQRPVYPRPNYGNPNGVRQVSYQPPAQTINPGLRQSLAQLQDALSPSDREMAVMTLSQYDHRRSPEIVHALLAGAKKDPAGTVRAACVNALVRMQISVDEMSSTLNALKKDADPRVRQAVQRALQGQNGSDLGRASVSQ